MTDLSFGRWLIAQALTGSIFSKLGAWLRSQPDAPLAKEWPLVYWVGEHYPKDSDGDPRELAKDALTVYERTVVLLAAQPIQAAAAPLVVLSTAELFAAGELKVSWLVWPFAAPGLSTIFDALPKLGKTRFFLEGIKASRDKRIFLGHATEPMRVIYVSEQSATSLAMQAREVGFTGDEPVEELCWITREYWSRFVFSEFLSTLEKQRIESGRYNCLLFDTWHTIARLENENDAAEVNRLGNLTLDLAARRNLALAMSRHDRKSGGDIGLSGRSSIQLSGLVDVILHLLRLPGQAGPNQRRLQLLGRVPNLPNDQVIELAKDGYRNFGTAEGGAETASAAETIMRRAPARSDDAMTITQILKGTELALSQPVRDAIEQLLGKKKLRVRVVKEGKKTAFYWAEQLALNEEL